MPDVIDANIAGIALRFETAPGLFSRPPRPAPEINRARRFRAEACAQPARETRVKSRKDSELKGLGSPNPPRSRCSASPGRLWAHANFKRILKFDGLAAASIALSPSSIA